MQTQKAQSEPLIKCCAQSHIDWNRADLPVRCPTPDMEIWAGHPRVYLELDDNDEARCPYCGTHFKVID